MDAAADDGPRRLGVRALHGLIVLSDAGYITGQPFSYSEVGHERTDRDARRALAADRRGRRRGA